MVFKCSTLKEFNDAISSSQVTIVQFGGNENKIAYFFYYIYLYLYIYIYIVLLLMMI